MGEQEMKRIASSFRMAFLIGIFVLTITTVPLIQAQEGAIAFFPTDDTYSGYPYGVVHGYEPVLKVGRGFYHTFMKFNISDIPEGAIGITAVLGLHTTYDGVPEPRFVAVFPLDNTMWNEETYPPNEFLDRYFTEKVVLWVTHNETWCEWNVTNIIVKAISNSSYVVAFVMMYDTSEETSPMLFTSKEGSAHALIEIPRLTITWTSVVPEFSFFLVPLAIVASAFVLFIFKARSRFSPTVSQRLLSSSGRCVQGRNLVALAWQVCT